MLCATPPHLAPDYGLFPWQGYCTLHMTPRTRHYAWQICAFYSGHLSIVNWDREARVLQLIVVRNHKIVGSNQNYFSFLWSRDIFSEGQFTAIYCEDYQLLQIEELCYRFEHQLCLDLPAATIKRI
jgi:hypothetical protein